MATNKVNLSPSEIFLIYHSRFQIEFLYRDAKQNTGLEHWQSTDADRLSFGYNVSLSAVNVAREISDRIHEATGRRLSVASAKRVHHNTSLYPPDPPQGHKPSMVADPQPRYPMPASMPRFPARHFGI